MSLNQSGLVDRITIEAHRLGFDLVGVVPFGTPTTFAHYKLWLEKGYHGHMAYLGRPDAVAKREDLAGVLPGVRSVVVVGSNYHTRPLPPELRDDPSRGIIASYAWGEDYHEVMLPRLRRLAALVEAGTYRPVAQRAYVDTGPILERDLAVRAGLGFWGKNTNLIHPRLGSWLFLAELLLAAELPSASSVRQGLTEDARKDRDQGCRPTVELPPSADIGSAKGITPYPGGQDIDLQAKGQRAERGTCGRCTRCLDACPTGALVAPYILDARRCISYLTIELKGPMPYALRPQMGNRIFGCDICQEVCPWNRRFARAAPEPAFQPGTDGVAPLLLDLFGLDDEGFRRRFRNSPIMRAKRRGLLRNVAVALGNWGAPAAVPALARALHDSEPLVRGHAAWALSRIGTEQARQDLAQAMSTETDEWVREELARLH